jgi:hypothetical protein
MNSDGFAVNVYLLSLNPFYYCSAHNAMNVSISIYSSQESPVQTLPLETLSLGYFQCVFGRFLDYFLGGRDFIYDSPI